MSCYVGSRRQCPFFRCYAEIDHEKYHRTLVRRYNGQPFSELGRFLIVLCHPFIHLHFASIWIIEHVTATLISVHVGLSQV